MKIRGEEFILSETTRLQNASPVFLPRWRRTWPILLTSNWLVIAVVSLDARMLLARVWNLEGEIAYSRTNRDTRASSVHRKDYALRFDNSWRTPAGTFDVFYTRIMPSFLAINARQVADLQDVLTRASIPLGPHVQLLGLYRRAEDTPREQNPTPATLFQAPEFRMSFRDLPGLGSAVPDFGYRARRPSSHRGRRPDRQPIGQRRAGDGRLQPL